MSPVHYILRYVLTLLSAAVVHSVPPVMDTIVAQYTRSPFENEFYSEEEQRNLTESLPPLSLKFDLPPVGNVSWCHGVHTQAVKLPGVVALSAGAHYKGIR